MILSDNETKVDLLNNEAIAKTIIELLREHPRTPVTVGVHGDWGAGKSSILEMIDDSVKADEKVLCIKVNSWRFQGFEDTKIALIESIVTGLIQKRPLLTKAGNAVKDTFKRIDWLKLAKHGGGLAWTATTGIPTPDQISAITGVLKGWLSNPTELATKENIESVAGNLGGLLKPAESKNVPQEIEEFRKAFDNLLDQAKIDQLIILVDDLDRCLPKTAIETLEAIRLFVFTQRTAFVIAADEAMIEYAVREHFPDLPDSTGPRDYARNYLEKLIQIPFRIPSLGVMETRIYITLLLVGSSIPEGDEKFGALIAIARSLLQRPWDTHALDLKTITETVGESVRIAEGVRLSDQIGPILATGSNGNPRLIKRFLNTLLLRQKIADARGFGSDVKLSILGKLMLAERFNPKLFERIAQISAAAADGKCKDLAALEATKVEASKDPPKDNVSDGPDLPEWLNSEAVKEWASVEPHIADVDLRPYLFVAKDRRDFFGSGSALGKIGQVANSLMGSKFETQGMMAELKSMVTGEADQVFELLRQRLVANGEFIKQPAGIDGIIALTAAQPHLENELVNFIDSLPPQTLGPWAVSGWSAAVKTPSQQERLGGIIEKWSKETKNKALCAAAQVAMKMPKK